MGGCRLADCYPFLLFIIGFIDFQGFEEEFMWGKDMGSRVLGELDDKSKYLGIKSGLIQKYNVQTHEVSQVFR